MLISSDGRIVVPIVVVMRTSFSIIVLAGQYSNRSLPPIEWTCKLANASLAPLTVLSRTRKNLREYSWQSSQLVDRTVAQINITDPIVHHRCLRASLALEAKSAN